MTSEIGPDHEQHLSGDTVHGPPLLEPHTAQTRAEIAVEAGRETVRLAESIELDGASHLDVAGSAFELRDIVDEMVTALVSRPGRTFLTALGTILGVGALVATLGLAKTAGNQIVTRFDELEATRVTVKPNNSFRNRTSVIPWDAEDRLTRLNGVSAAGIRADVDLGGGFVSSVPVVDPSGITEYQIPVIAVSPGMFDATRATLYQGRFFDAGHEERADRVAVLGIGAAQQLNITRVNNQPVVFVNDEPLVVIGILDSVGRVPELTNSIIIPTGVGQERFGLQAPSEVLIEVDIGAAELIEAQAPTALAPNAPELLTANAPQAPTRVRADVQGDVNSLFLILGAISLLAGAIGIANVTLVSVLERTAEIGLRRSVGATPRHIATQFLGESVALGALAGIFGASIGIVTIVAVSATREWTPVIDLWIPFAAPLLGALVGLVAGAYPAAKASRIEPISALRGSG